MDIPKDTVNPNFKYPYKYPESVELRSYNPTVNGHKGQIKKSVKSTFSGEETNTFLSVVVQSLLNVVSS